LQLFALNDDNELVLASKAVRQRDYRCPECHSRVRARGGESRTTHYFHLDDERSCRQSGKSMQHLQTQFCLQQAIPDIRLELPFPSISRIADAAWEKEKIVFEIQCSPITATELRARNRDYASVGWTAIWIFHDDRYNKRKITAAEWSLRHIPHYFTNIDEQGIGEFYSHLADSKRGIRMETIFRRDVDFLRPCRIRNAVHFEEDGWREHLVRKVPRVSLVGLAVRGATLLLNNLKGIYNHFLEKACR
jgi:competence protein CoiA